MPPTPPPDGTPAGRRVIVVLELRPDPTVIAGTMRVPSGPAREFYGWIELVAGLEALRPLEGRAEPAGDGAN